MKRIARIHRPAGGHWVGNGFPVRTLISYQEPDPDVSPFLLFDYAGPADFPPSERPRGVEEHPHRGFETVTIVFDGELVHRDSAGNSGRIGPGDVQWMTAASGVVHEEMHAPEFTRRGGRFEVVQLWVNLPSKHKLSEPRYQTLLRKDIPVVELGGGASARLIAGELNGVRGPARTVTPVLVWDLRLPAGADVELPIPAGFNAAIAVMHGPLEVAGESVSEASYSVLGSEGDRVRLVAHDPATALLLAGEPIREPVVGYGPFVMNTNEEIRQAIHDYQSGRMGHLAAVR